VVRIGSCKTIEQNSHPPLTCTQYRSGRLLSESLVSVLYVNKYKRVGVGALNGYDLVTIRKTFWVMGDEYNEFARSGHLL